METKKNQNQIVITMNAEDEKQKLPMSLIFSMVAGTITGTAFVLILFMGVKLVFGL